MTQAPGARAYRLDDIDLLRGLVIVIMALDHARDYFMLAVEQDPMTNPQVTAGLFFTRWITHFCAPVFVFLAGTSAGLMAARKSPAELGGFLLRRGCWLIFIEIVVVALGWTFAPTGIAELDGRILIPMQVIWAIGAAMIVLAGAQWLGRGTCLALGLVITLAHNLLDPHWPAGTMTTLGLPWWAQLHGQAGYIVGPFFIAFIYPVIPWIGLLLLGYGTAGVFQLEEPRRRRALLRAGTLSVIAFVLLRALDVYGDPNRWQMEKSLMSTVIDFLNVSKYPPSLLFVLMTLGPAALLCANASRITATIRRPLIVFGRVPFMFYMAHIYLIHTLSILLAWVQGFDVHSMLNVMVFYPKEYGLPLAGVYAMWVLVVLLMYPLCKWMAGIKARRRDWWLSYL